MTVSPNKGFTQLLVVLLVFIVAGLSAYMFLQKTNLRSKVLRNLKSDLPTSPSKPTSPPVGSFALGTYLGKENPDFNTFWKQHFNSNSDFALVFGPGSLNLLNAFPSRSRVLVYSTRDSSQASTFMSQAKAAGVSAVMSNIEDAPNINVLNEAESSQFKLAQDQSLTFIFAPTGTMLRRNNNYEKLAPNSDIIFYQTESLQDNPDTLGQDSTEYIQNYASIVKGMVTNMKQLPRQHQVWVQVSVNPPANRCISADQVIKYIDSIEDGSGNAADAIVIFYNLSSAFDKQCGQSRAEVNKLVIKHYRP